MNRSVKKKTGKSGLTARDIMATRLRTVRPDDRVYQAVKVLLKYKISGAPVIDEQRKLIGVISEKDCIKALMRAVHDRMPPSAVADVMSRELITIREGTHLMDIAHIFITRSIRRLPVVSDTGELIGQVSRRDLLAAANRIFEDAPSRESAVLYLSALGKRAPV
ncbi:MAG: CBS domain-containing protein [Myxococcota bacterium]|jgi:CBS domain-containing protein